MKQNTDFSVLRTDYYNSGRLLFFSGNFHGVGIMLGYAIEVTFKAALNFRRIGNKGILYSHDLPEIYLRCCDEGLFQTVKVSDDFLEYANDRLNQRYPSQMATTLEELNKQGRFSYIGFEFLQVYDDLLIQLDDELVLLTNDEFASVGVRNAASASSYKARVFFHCNGPAILRLKEYSEIVRQKRPQNQGDIEVLEKGEDFLWDFKYMPATVDRNPSVDKNTHPAADFKYPKHP